MSNEEEKPPQLSSREKECLLHLARGLRVQELASSLGISAKTAEKQIASARKKIGAATREQAIAIAISKNLL